MERCGPLILTALRGQRRTPDGLRMSWRSHMRANIHRLTFHDLRGLAVVRQMLANVTLPRIATCARHSQRDREALVDACPFRKSYPGVMVMQPSQDRNGYNGARSLDSSMQGRILL